MKLRIRIKKTPNCRHLYSAHIRNCGWYGWGNTPAEARAKLLEILAREGWTP